MITNLILQFSFVRWS